MKLIQVYSTEGQLEAEMVKGFLEAQGLNVTLSQESIGRTLGLSAGRLGQVKVLVPESQVTAAVDLLEAMEKGDFEDEDFSDFIDEN
jgi:vacuolar-type H+-ATPase subunit B/Vma2